MTWIKGLILAAALVFLISCAPTQAHSGAVIRVKPPAAKVVVRPAKPFKNAVWVSGHWRWQGGKYAWVSGKWKRARSGYVWNDGRWKQSRRGYVWIPGRWKKR